MVFAKAANLDEVVCDEYNARSEEKISKEEVAKSRQEGQLQENSEIVRETGPTTQEMNKQPLNFPVTTGTSTKISSLSKPTEKNVKTVFKFTANLLDDQKKRKSKNFTEVLMENMKNKANQPTSLRTKNKRNKKQLPPTFTHKTMKEYFKPKNSTCNPPTGATFDF